ncbi:MAG TPA: hypothetical protein VN944_09190 [Nitrospiria bacterium]|nr:hypothetical protein [Nitrospiria bacterium]
MSKKSSKDINKLAAFIVAAISQKESLTPRIKEKSTSTIAPERFFGPKGNRSRAERNAEKIRGIIALKAAMDRRSKSV